jgi:cytochrome c biogenesis protein CcdA
MKANTYIGKDVKNMSYSPKVWEVLLAACTYAAGMVLAFVVLAFLIIK